MKNKIKIVQVATLFVVSFIIYLLTIVPGVTFTDSGELAAVCVTLGIAHPTGYPIFTLLGHLWTYLPLPLAKISSLNIFAAFVTSLSSVFFYLLFLNVLTFLEKFKSESIKDKKIKAKSQVKNSLSDYQVHYIAFFISLLYAFAGTVWAQANSIEVYSLQLLLVNITLFIFTYGILINDSNNKYIFLAVFFTGLSFSNHLTTILIVPALLFLLFKRPGKKFDFTTINYKFLLICALFLLAGLSLYLYLFLRSSSMPEFNWGWVSRNFDKFKYHVTGKQYQVWMFSGSETIATNFNKFINLLQYQFAWIGLIFTVYGAYSVFRISKTIFYFILILVITCLVYSMNYSIMDIDSYFLVAFIGLMIYTGIGFAEIVKKKNSLLFALLIIPVFSLLINYNKNDQSNNYLVPEYTRIMYESLDKNAIIFSAQWDFWASAFWYYQRVEGIRKDVVLIEKELLRRTWYLDQLKRWYPNIMNEVKTELNDYLGQLELFESGGEYDPVLIQTYFLKLINSIIEKNIDKRSIYLTPEILQKGDEDIGSKYQKFPQGFAIRLTKGDDIFPVNISKMKLDRFVKSIDYDDDYHLSKGIAVQAANNLVNLARYASMTNNQAEVIKAIDFALKIDPNNELALNIKAQLRR